MNTQPSKAQIRADRPWALDTASVLFSGGRNLFLVLVGAVVFLVGGELAIWLDLLGPEMRWKIVAGSLILAMIWLVLGAHLLGCHHANLRQFASARDKDIAEAERLTRLAKEASDEAVAAKANLVANMSHEIRTPMNGIIGFAQLLLSTKMSNEQRKYAELILESGNSLIGLLNDILDIAKLDSDKMEIVPERTNIRDLANNTVAMMRAAARQKSLKLDVRVDCAIPHELALDGLRVKQILNNLVGNAIKFTEKGGVTITVKPVQVGPVELIEFGVSDTGIGIATEWQTVIFEQFVQADASLQRSFGGSGLGLTISHKLAQLMGGTLTLESSEGAGTWVALRLPLEEVELGLADASGHLESAFPDHAFRPAA